MRQSLPLPWLNRCREWRDRRPDLLGTPWTEMGENGRACKIVGLERALIPNVVRSRPLVLSPPLVALLSP